MKQYIELLGEVAGDKVTKLRGVVTAISFNLNGCVDAALSQERNADGTFKSVWIAVNQLEIISNERKVNPPDFSKLCPKVEKAKAGHMAYYPPKFKKAKAS